jgi:hypothetical protein
MATKEFSFGVIDPYGRDCGCWYEIKDHTEGGCYVRFQATRYSRKYQALKWSEGFADHHAATAYAEKMVENYRNRCEKQFAAPVVAAEPE